MYGLTRRQLQCLRIVARGIADGFPPTLREIGREMRITSTNGVNDHLRALERKGMIRIRDGAISRGIQLTERGTAETGVQLSRPHRMALLEELYRCALALRACPAERLDYASEAYRDALEALLVDEARKEVA